LSQTGRPRREVQHEERRKRNQIGLSERCQGRIRQASASSHDTGTECPIRRSRDNLETGATKTGRRDSRRAGRSGRRGGTAGSTGIAARHAIELRAAGSVGSASCRGRETRRKTAAASPTPPRSGRRNRADGPPEGACLSPRQRSTASTVAGHSGNDRDAGPHNRRSPPARTRRRGPSKDTSRYGVAMVVERQPDDLFIRWPGRDAQLRRAGPSATYATAASKAAMGRGRTIPVEGGESLAPDGRHTDTCPTPHSTDALYPLTMRKWGSMAVATIATSTTGSTRGSRLCAANHHPQGTAAREEFQCGGGHHRRCPHPYIRTAFARELLSSRNRRAPGSSRYTTT
jgi:hypothetical protein